jgi:excinuclease ABC subunit B
MGRASRNIKGRVVLYADKMTDSMKRAIMETNRRRSKQIEFNEKHKITPKSTQRKLGDALEIKDPLEEVRGKGKKDTGNITNNRSFEELEQAMKDAAGKLDFEEAARIRDLIKKLYYI